MTAVCNLRRAREDQVNQRQAGLGKGPGSHSTAQPQGQGHSSAHNLQLKPGLIVVRDNDGDDLTETPATPSSRGQFTGTIRDAEANITQHLRDENEVLTNEIRRLRDKERNRADEERRLREQLQQQTYLAQEARVSYHREVASHDQTAHALSESRKDYNDGEEERSTKPSSETMPSHDETALTEPSATAQSEAPQSVRSSTASPVPATDAAGSTTKAEGGSGLRYSDLPVVKEARRSQLSADMFFKDGVATPLPTRIARNPFQTKKRKRKHTRSDTNVPDPAAQASATEDKDTSMEGADSDETIPPPSANTTRETPATPRGQAGSPMTSAGTQTRLSAAPYASPARPIGKDLDSTVLRAVFGRGRGRTALLKIPGSGGGDFDDEVLFGVQRKWERSVSFHKVRAAEGDLAALQMLETAATLGCLSRGAAFPPSVDAYIQGVREALLSAHRGDKTDAALAN